jgi:hypothetical protein
LRPYCYARLQPRTQNGQAGDSNERKGKIMKVIATTKTGFLLEASDNEIANLIGYYSAYHVKNRFAKREIVNVGDEIKIADMYNSLCGLVGKIQTMEQVRASLRAVAASMEIVDPLLREIKEVVDAHPQP